MNDNVPIVTGVDRSFRLPSHIIPYCGAALAVLLAVGVRWLLRNQFDSTAVYVTFYPMVALVSLLAGGGPSAFATLLSAVVVETWIGFGTGSSGEILAMGLFVAGGMLISVAAAQLRHSKQRELEERLLMDRELRFRTFTQATSAMVFTMSPDWTVMRYLKGPEFIADTDEPSQTWLQRYIPLEDQSFVSKIIQQSIRDRKLFELEHRVIRVDGSVGWVHSRAIPVLDSDGRITEWFGTAMDVSREKEIQQALCESEERLRLFVEHAPVAIAMFDRQMKYLAVSQRWRSDFLPHRGNVLGRCHYDVFPECPERWRSAYVRGLTGEVVKEEQDSWTDRNGRKVWLRYEIRPWFASDGAIGGIVLFSEDITLRTEAQENVRKGEQRLKAEADALSRLNQAGFRLWQMQTMNDGLQEMLRATMDLVGADMGTIQIPDGRQNALKVQVQHGFTQTFLNSLREANWQGNSASGRALRTGETVVIEDVDADPSYASLRNVARAAGYRSVQAIPLPDRDGQPLGVISTHFRSPHTPDESELQRLDLYARQAADFIQYFRTAEALRNREERLRAILRTATDAIISIDSRGVIHDANPATERLFGYTRDELIDRNVSMLMPEPFCSQHHQYLSRYLQTREARIIGKGREVAGRRKDGSVFPADLSVNEVDHQGIFTGFIRDVSERNRLQRDVLRIAEEEQRRIGQDLHDSVQQQLAGLGMLARTLQENLSNAAEPQENVCAGEDSPQCSPTSPEEDGVLQSGRIARCCELTEKIFNGLRRAHKDVRQISKDLLPLNLAGDGLMVSLRELANRIDDVENVTCAFKCDHPVTIDDSATVTHLYRIAQEAVTNALKHAEAEHILIALDLQDGQPVLTVADDGHGIDHDAQNSGMGMKIMQYRAGLIGAGLTISPVENGGVLVTCKVFGKGPLSNENAAEDHVSNSDCR